jgi:hypothetical protein
MYKALLHSEAPIHKNKHIWKMKIPLRIKVFAWYLRRGVILTKDNLVRGNWQGSPKCCFCHHDETIKHLFFQCLFAHSIWSAIQVASSLSPPRSVANIFGNWLHGIDNRDRVHIRVGAIALIWSLWLCINNMVFEAKCLRSLCTLTPGVIYSTETGILRRLYGGLFKVGASGERGFYPTWMAA